MKTTICAAMLAMFWLVGCGDTINNNFYGHNDAADDAFVEPDEGPLPDNFSEAEPDESTPPIEDVEEEWAPGCNPPWPDGTKLHCDEFWIDFCELLWDKGSCTASCWDPNDMSLPVFRGTSPEAVPAQWPDGFGCSPV